MRRRCAQLLLLLIHDLLLLLQVSMSSEYILFDSVFARIGRTMAHALRAQTRIIAHGPIPRERRGERGRVLCDKKPKREALQVVYVHFKSIGELQRLISGQWRGASRELPRSGSRTKSMPKMRAPTRGKGRARGTHPSTTRQQLHTARATRVPRQGRAQRGGHERVVSWILGF
jgi:hypothetical protein